MGGDDIRLLQVYTGNGKGKTTAALGLCMRAAGRGMKSLVIQFMKGMEYGELCSFERISEVTIEQHGRAGFVDKCAPSPEDKEMAAKALERARGAVSSGEYDIVVLDEINVAIFFKLIALDDALEVLRGRNARTEVVCTGRYAPEAFIDMADLVTEMKEIRHPYSKNIASRKGIEY